MWSDKHAPNTQDSGFSAVTVGWFAKLLSSRRALLWFSNVFMGRRVIDKTEIAKNIMRCGNQAKVAFQSAVNIPLVIGR